MARSGVAVRGLTRTLKRWRRITRAANDYFKQQLPVHAESVRDLAQLMAPRQTGALESAIKIGEVKTGLFRHTAEVIVDSTTPYGGTLGGDRVGDYAAKVHSEWAPAGGRALGPSSQRKQLQTPGVLVGGGFMTRAFDEIAPRARTELRAGIRRAIK